MPNLIEINKFPVLVDGLIKSKKRKMSAVGKKIIEQRLKKIGEFAPNNQPIEMSRVLLIKKGETVPKAFQSIPNLKIDRKGVAAESYSDGWCQSHWNESSGWGDTWGECWDNSTSTGRLSKSVLVMSSITQTVKAFSLNEFSTRELEAFSKLGVLN